MSVAERLSPARPSGGRVAVRIRQVVAQGLYWLDSKNNVYSPAICVSALLLVGLIVKLAPALHVAASN
jgi:hypothetical protein